MKKFVNALTLSMLIVAWGTSFGQQIKITGKDTFVVMPIKQLRKANERFVQLAECQERNDSLYFLVRASMGLTNNLRGEITSLKEAIAIDSKLIGDKDKIISLSDQQIKKNHRNSTIIKWERNGLAGACAILLLKAFLFK